MIILISLVKEARMRIKPMSKVTMLGRGIAGTAQDLWPSVQCTWVPSAPPPQRLPGLHLSIWYFCSPSCLTNSSFFSFFYRTSHILCIITSCPFCFQNISQICSVLSISIMYICVQASITPHLSYGYGWPPGLACTVPWFILYTATR